MSGSLSPETRLAVALARHWLAPSERFEDTCKRAGELIQDGLRCLATLDQATLLSIQGSPRLDAVHAGHVGQAGAPMKPHSPSPSLRAPSNTPKFGSHRQEYQPALENSSVVDALLKLHRQSRGPTPAEAPLETFRSLQAPKVDARPKPLVDRQRPSPPGTRVFRSRSET